MKRNTAAPMIRVSSEDLAREPHPHAPSKLAHVVMKTPRRREMAEWYTTVLDGTVTFEDRMITFITYDHEHHRIALIGTPWLLRIPGIVWSRHRKFWGVDHIAFTYESLDKLVTNYRRLADLGIEPVWTINHGPTTSMYYEDPDGHRLELQVDNFATNEELLAWLDSGEFEADPIGVDFDPDVLEARIAQGVPRRELVKRGSAVPAGARPRAGLRTITWKTL
ncbi:VOC family protein [Tsukamurella sp. 8F]|uniref:VOC family protein n=1 Tax=unclassified Tsukamurella TaxID=2633480 RepID=UPI0023B88DF8|nr:MULTISPECIES: VOC family protein [unclassified Tsukamurella]MDF0531725.1 VOC family protein [Tsukamurella sp. 8J]MDF0588971.1 VOC family protein [Tsukamurella sp. 8F]